MSAQLAIADLNPAAASETLAQVEQSEQGLALTVDVADAEATRQVIERVAERYGRLDILVNCAADDHPGIARYASSLIYPLREHLRQVSPSNQISCHVVSGQSRRK